MVRYTTRCLARGTGRLPVGRPSRRGQGRKTFLDSDDAKEKDEPQKFLPDYDKLIKGKDADWVYFPDGGGPEVVQDGLGQGVRRERPRPRVPRRRPRRPDYMEQWLEKQGFKIVKSGGDVVIEGNVFNAWEPHGAARYWGGWAANPGVGFEILAKDSKGTVLAEIRHKVEGLDDPGRRRERPGGRRQVAREGTLRIESRRGLSTT